MPLQAGARERVDQAHLVVGRDDLGLVLEAVARADLADADGLWKVWHRTLNIYSPPLSEPIAIIGATGALGFGLALRWGAPACPSSSARATPSRAVEAAERARAALPDGRFDGLRERRGARAGRRRPAQRPVPQPVRDAHEPQGRAAPGPDPVDATVPLAAAVSGKATRMLGVWQGSAGQQAQEMVPDGVRVVSALHTVSARVAAATSTTTLDEDVLVCGDRRDDKERVIGAHRPHRRAALRRLRAPGDGAHHRVAHRAADRDQRALQGARRDPDHRSLRPWSSSSPAAPAARSSRAACSTWSATSSSVIANTGDDVEIYGAYVSPDPDLVRLLARRPHRRARLGPARRHVQRDGRAARARRRRVVQPRRPRPRDRPARARERLREGARADRGARRADARRSGCAARVLPMADEPVRTWVLRARRAGWPLPGVHDPRARRGARRRRRARRASRRARAPQAVLDGDRRRARDRHRPVEPGHLDPPDPRRARHRATRCAPRARRSSPSRRSSAARCSRARPRPSWRGPGLPARAAGVAARLRGPARRHRRRRARRRPARAADRHAHGRRRARAARGRARCCASRRRLCARSDAYAAPSCRSSASTTPSSASTRRSTRGTRRALAEAMVTDVLHRAAPRRAHRRGHRRHRREPAPRRSRARYDAATIADDERGHSHAARSASTGRSSAASSASCSSPATAPRSTPASSTRCCAAAR